MFYSHEILTSRKYGVATVWLVATLGAKSNSKKITRKAILDVDVNKACMTVMAPDAPLALRLQSSLLFGISRVYDQQCGYVLADCQMAQNNMRALFKLIKGKNLDVNPSKIRSDNLMLEDDPAFDIELSVPSLDFDFMTLEQKFNALAPYASSLLSPDSQSRRNSASSRNSSALSLVLPESHSSSAYQLPDFGPSHISSASKPRDVERSYEDDYHLMLDEADFEIDEHGDLRELSSPEMIARRAESVVTLPGRLLSDSIGSGQVYQDRPEGQNPSSAYAYGEATHVGFPDSDPFDYHASLPEAAAFPSDEELHMRSDLSEHLREETSSESREVPLRKQRKKAPVMIVPDIQQELLSQDLKDWHDNYLPAMATILKAKHVRSTINRAKATAHLHVWGQGIGKIGCAHGTGHLQEPLAMFAGDSLRFMITGKAIPSKKRRRDDPGSPNAGEDNDEENRRVRSRSMYLSPEDEYQLGRGQDDDLAPFDVDDSLAIELGREAETPLEDRHSSTMPWNVSGSLRSYRAGSSAVQRPSSGRAARHSSINAGRLPGSRLTSASPLLGRGRLGRSSELPDFERIEDMSDEPAVGFDEGDAPSSSVAQQQRVTQFEQSTPTFQLQGPSVAQGTQATASSQFLREELAREGLNFLAYVRNTIQESLRDELAEADEIPGSEDAHLHEASTTFEGLISPSEYNVVVASQAFLHVLALATKSLLVVKQDAEDEWGDIEIRVASVGI